MILLSDSLRLNDKLPVPTSVALHDFDYTMHTNVLQARGHHNHCYRTTNGEAENKTYSSCPINPRKPGHGGSKITYKEHVDMCGGFEI